MNVIIEMKLSSFIFYPSLIYPLPLKNDGKAKPKILCLHGGGQTAWGFSHMKGMTDLVEALPEFEFVFASSPDPNHVWIRDPPNGKDEPTTDPGMISKLNFLFDAIYLAKKMLATYVADKICW